MSESNLFAFFLVVPIMVAVIGAVLIGRDDL